MKKKSAILTRPHFVKKKSKPAIILKNRYGFEQAFHQASTQLGVKIATIKFYCMETNFIILISVIGILKIQITTFFLVY